MLATYTALFDGLFDRRLAYVSIIHPDAADGPIQTIRRLHRSASLINTGFSRVTDRQTAANLVDAGHADAVAVGRPAIANPDLPLRWQTDQPEAAPDETTFYEGGASGYTDYPALTPMTTARQLFTEATSPPRQPCAIDNGCH